MLQGADAGEFNSMMADLKMSLGVPDQVSSKMSKFIDFSNEEEFKKLCDVNPDEKSSGYTRVTKADKLGITMEVHKANIPNGEVVWRN